jgi:hypothetical protein
VRTKPTYEVAIPTAAYLETAAPDRSGPSVLPRVQNLHEVQPDGAFLDPECNYVTARSAAARGTVRGWSGACMTSGS